MRIYKRFLFGFLITLMPMSGWSQKLTLGSCITKDKGQYSGEMLGGKAHGKGKNGLG